MKNESEKRSENETPWRVRCGIHGPVNLTKRQYDAQMSRPWNKWTCPRCGDDAWFDDDYHERAMGIAEGEDNEAPTSPCPRCGAAVEDELGTGALAHLARDHANGCGYCSHPTETDGRCGICSAELDRAERG